MGSSFQPERALQFDLEKGEVRIANEDRVVVVPVEAVRGAVMVGRETPPTMIGRACGERIGRRLGGPLAVTAAPADDVARELHGELALAGLGVPFFERWGDAFVIGLKNSPLDPDATGELIASVLAAASAIDLHCSLL